MTKEHELKCPACGGTVKIQQHEMEGTVSVGGRGTVGVNESAVCPKCGKDFTLAEIDALGRWV